MRIAASVLVLPILLLHLLHLFLSGWGRGNFFGSLAIVLASVVTTALLRLTVVRPGMVGAAAIIEPNSALAGWSAQTQEAIRCVVAIGLAVHSAAEPPRRAIRCLPSSLAWGRRFH